MSLDTAFGAGRYHGSPAELDDRREGIKTGGRVLWKVTPGPLEATITGIETDEDGDPWFHLTFDGDAHKDVRVERDEIMPLRQKR